jgi:prolipoprotein diacylglyceryltransferase
VALVVGYGVLRSLIELLRGDASRGHVGPLSTSQLLALVTVTLTVAMWRLHARSGPDGQHSSR